MKVTEFDIKISVENVCKMLDADKSGDLYEEIVEELEEMLPEAYKKICPAAVFEFGSLANGIEEISSIRSEEHTSELQSRFDLVCSLLLEKKNKYYTK